MLLLPYLTPASFATLCASLLPDRCAPSAVAIFSLVASPANRMRPCGLASVPGGQQQGGEDGW